MCKHENDLLMGTADGIVCRGCGKVFATFDDLAADLKPKRAKKKKDEEEKDE